MCESRQGGGGVCVYCCVRAPTFECLCALVHAGVIGGNDAFSASRLLGRVPGVPGCNALIDATVRLDAGGGDAG